MWIFSFPSLLIHMGKVFFCVFTWSNNHNPESSEVAVAEDSHEFKMGSSGRLVHLFIIKSAPFPPIYLQQPTIIYQTKANPVSSAWWYLSQNRTLHRTQRTNSRTRPNSCCLVAGATSQRNLVTFNIVHPAFLSPPKSFHSRVSQQVWCTRKRKRNLFLLNQQLNHNTANTFVSNSGGEKPIQKQSKESPWDWISFYLSHIS